MTHCLSEVEHVCNALGLSQDVSENLTNYHQISTWVDLSSKKDQLEKGNLCNIKKPAQKQLSKVFGWIEDWTSSHNGTAPDLLKDFTEDEYCSFDEKRHAMFDMKDFVPLVLNSFHEEGGDGCITKLPQSTIKSIYKLIVDRVETQLSEDLREKSWCRKFLEPWTRAILNLPNRDSYEKPFVVTGQTQSGKSPVKVVLSALCYHVGCPLVIVTKGVREMKELHAKLKDLAFKTSSGEEFSEKFHSGGVGGDVWKSKERRKQWTKEFREGGIFVLADSGPQLDKTVQIIQQLRNKKPHFSFALCVDEADAMYRTLERTQIFEQKYHRLMALGPKVKVMISATPLPVMFILKDIERKDLEFLSIAPDEDYCGLREMKVLYDRYELPRYLPKGGLRMKHTYPFDAAVLREASTEYKLHHVASEKKWMYDTQEVDLPACGELNYTDDTTIKGLYNDALNGTNKRGVLILDITNPRVYVEGNVFQRATCIQDMFFAKGKQFAAIVSVGKGLAYRLPGYRLWTTLFKEKDITVSDLIGHIDEMNPDLSMPVAVFGYSKMRRGISYRSSKRVPTHMIVSMGNGFSIDSMIQTLGRGTFTGKSILLANGHPHVTMLTTETDWFSAQAYLQLVLEIERRYNNNESINEIFTGFREKLPAEMNYNKMSPRKNGELKNRALDASFENLVFKKDSGELSVSQKRIKQDFSNSPMALCVMRVLKDIQTKDRHDYHFLADILEAYNDTYNQSSSLDDEKSSSGDQESAYDDKESSDDSARYSSSSCKDLTLKHDWLEILLKQLETHGVVSSRPRKEIDSCEWKGNIELIDKLLPDIDNDHNMLEDDDESIVIVPN